MPTNYHAQLEKRALEDLTHRAAGGTVMYLLVWIVLAFYYQLPQLDAQFFYVNSFLLGTIFIFRSLQYAVYKLKPAASVERMNRWLVASVLLAALHWGLLMAWVIYVPELESIRGLLLIVTAAFAIGGASTLSISSEIRSLYPFLMLFPAVLVMLAIGGDEYWVLSILCMFALVYVYNSTKITSNDYWEAITNHMVAEERAALMEKLSLTDQLTQLKNRMYFDARILEEWKRCSRLQSPLSILMLDLDHFKELNDNHGHVFGDECLRKVALTLSLELQRTTDCVARYGGEEFVVLLPNTSAADALLVADRLLRAVANVNLSIDGNRVSLTCSIGVATRVPSFQNQSEGLIKQADEALYQAKENGRNQICIAE